MPRKLLIVLLVAIFLGFLTIGYFILKYFLFSPKISFRSEYPDYVLTSANPKIFENYLDTIYFWDKNRIPAGKGNTNERVTAKKLEIILTDQEQPYDKLVSPTSKNDVYSSWGIDALSNGKIILHVHVNLNLLKGTAIDVDGLVNNILFENLYEVAQGTNRRDKTIERSQVDSLEPTSSEKFFVKIEKKKSILEQLISLITPITSAQTCNGNIECGTWYQAASTCVGGPREGEICSNNSQCPGGYCNIPDPECQGQGNLTTCSSLYNNQTTCQANDPNACGLFNCVAERNCQWNQGSFCGDGTCNGGETCSTCSQDCGICPTSTPIPTPPPSEPPPPAGCYVSNCGGGPNPPYPNCLQSEKYAEGDCSGSYNWYAGPGCYDRPSCPHPTPTPTSTPTPSPTPNPTCTIDIPAVSSVSIGTPRILTAVVNVSNGVVDRVNFVSGDVTKYTASSPATPPPPYRTTLTGLNIGAGIPLTAQALLVGGGSCTDQGLVNVSVPGPWWAVSDGDIISGGSILSDVPATSGMDLISNSASFSPGVAIYSGSIAPGPNPTSPKVSLTNWNTDTTLGFNPTTLNYDHFYSLVPAQAVPLMLGPTIGNNTLSCTSGESNYYGGYCWFERQGDLTIPGPQNLNSNKVVLFVNGKLTINDKVNSNDGTGIFVVFAKNNIEVTSNVYTNNSPALEGVFFTDKYFVTLLHDKILNVRGTVSALTGFDLKRNPGKDNPTTPGEYFQFAPDFVFNFPRYFSGKSTTWKEIAP